MCGNPQKCGSLEALFKGPLILYIRRTKNLPCFTAFLGASSSLSDDESSLDSFFAGTFFAGTTFLVFTTWKMISVSAKFTVLEIT